MADLLCAHPGHSPLELHHRTCKGIIVPYVELDVPRGVGSDADCLPITEVHYGPRPDPRLKIAGVRSLANIAPNWRSVELKGSLAPLRP